MRIRPGQNELEIQYTGLRESRPSQIRFKYQLEGLDRAWTDASTRRTAYYSHLPPGTYRFRVRADDGEGRWNENEASVALVVNPPFWRTSWFYAFVGLSVAGAVGGAFRFRIQQLKRRQAAQESFSRHLLDAHESERRRIAAELHDSLGQSLVLIKNSAARGALGGGDPAMTQAQFEQITERSASAISEVREIAYNLRPYLLDQFGLSKAIRALFEQAAVPDALEIHTAIDDVTGSFSSEAEMSIYRIAQESLNNILKHAQATKVEMILENNGSAVLLEIRDNGCGFDPRAANGGERRGFGLLGVSERVRLLGALHSIRSTPGDGTTVSIRFQLGDKYKGGQNGDSDHHRAG